MVSKAESEAWECGGMGIKTLFSRTSSQPICAWYSYVRKIQVDLPVR